LLQKLDKKIIKEIFFVWNNKKYWNLYFKFIIIELNNINKDAIIGIINLAIIWRLLSRHQITAVGFAVSTRRATCSYILTFERIKSHISTFKKITFIHLWIGEFWEYWQEKVDNYIYK